MAGIELNTIATANAQTQQVSSNAPAQENIRRTSEVKAEDTAKVKAEDAAKVKAEDTARAKEKEELENVVARSEDGDTVQVSEDGATELEESLEGTVIAETTEPAETTRTSVENREEPDFEVERPVISTDDPPYGEYTTSELETMYQQGEISAYSYNSELERRESIREAAMGENKEFSKEMSALNSEAQRTKEANFAIDTAINSESKIDLNDRLAAVDRSVEKEKNQARITEEEGRLWDYQLRA